MQADTTDRAIVQSTIQLAHNLGMRAVAEGVEDQPTWDTLNELGCDVIQGYQLSRPLPPDAVDDFLDAHPTSEPLPEADQSWVSRQILGD
jgi:EAL domain-containing protein (putative c-di-GMP-specific phosphodiesterase class I)